MSHTIIANIDKLYDLGVHGGQVEWIHALHIADQYSQWLENSLKGAVKGMREWWQASGGSEPEKGALPAREALAIFVQEIGHELALLNRYTTESEDESLEGWVHCCDRVQWDQESEYPCGGYFIDPADSTVKVEFYTGP